MPGWTGHSTPVSHVRPTACYTTRGDRALFVAGNVPLLISGREQGVGSAYAASALVRQALWWPKRSTRLVALLVCQRLFRGNMVRSFLAMQHIIAPPPPPIDMPDDEMYVPTVPTGRVLLDGLVEAIQCALRSQAQPADDPQALFEREAAQAACYLLEQVLEHGGPTTRELATRIPLNLGLGERSCRASTACRMDNSI
jgi:hypothetical protein